MTEIFFRKSIWGHWGSSPGLVVHPRTFSTWAIQGIKAAIPDGLTLSPPCIWRTQDCSSQRLLTVSCQKLREAFIKLNTGIKAGNSCWVDYTFFLYLTDSRLWSSQHLFTISAKRGSHQTGPTFYPVVEGSFTCFVWERYTTFRTNPPQYHSSPMFQSPSFLSFPIFLLVLQSIISPSGFRNIF